MSGGGGPGGPLAKLKGPKNFSAHCVCMYVCRNVLVCVYWLVLTFVLGLESEFVERFGLGLEDDLSRGRKKKTFKKWAETIWSSVSPKRPRF